MRILSTNKLLTQKQLISQINQLTQKQKRLLEMLSYETPVSLRGVRYNYGRQKS